MFEHEAQACVPFVLIYWSVLKLKRSMLTLSNQSSQSTDRSLYLTNHIDAHNYRIIYVEVYTHTYMHLREAWLRMHIATTRDTYRQCRPCTANVSSGIVYMNQIRPSAIVSLPTHFRRMWGAVKFLSYTRTCDHTFACSVQNTQT